MKKLCSLIVLFLICSSLLIPIQASANSGGEIDCSVTPDECEQMIAAQALVIQDLGGEPVPWPGQTPVLSSEDVVATGDWAFVEEYTQRMLEIGSALCTNYDFRSYLQMEGGLAFIQDDINQSSWVGWNNHFAGVIDGFFEVQAEFNTRLQAEIDANGGVVPDGIPDHAYTVSEILVLLDSNGYPYCSYGNYSQGK